MNAISRMTRSSMLLITGVAGLLVLCFAMIATNGGGRVVAAENQCNVLLMLDRSASIGDSWMTMRTQVDNLLTSDQLLDERVALGYWTFSNVPNPQPDINFNAPYHTYVSLETGRDSVPGFATFLNPLPTDPNKILSGQTNYEQAFGYHNSAPNTSSSKKDGFGNEGIGSISDLRNDADVLVLVTDGLPNYPADDNGDPLDGNSTAVARGYAARQQYDGKKVIGVYVSNNGVTPDLSSLRATVNGNPGDNSNVYSITNFGAIEDQLTDYISGSCDVQTQDYSLTPVVSTGSSGVQAGDEINFSYSVEKTSTSGASATSPWQLYDVMIKPDAGGNPLDFNDAGRSKCPAGSSQPYCNMAFTSNLADNCGQILAMISGKGTCDPVPAGGRGECGNPPVASTRPGSGTTTFTQPVNTEWYQPARCQIVGDLPPGTLICSMLALAKPTSSTSTTRLSSASCVIVAKTPLLQVHGGDLRVGRGETDAVTTPAGVYVSRFKITKDAAVVPNGRTFGSWVEYGVLAPGPIRNMASLSGYARGYDGPLGPSVCDEGTNRLTFSNTPADEGRDASRHDPGCGYFTDIGDQLPDVKSAIESVPLVSPSRYTTPLTLGADSDAGRYENRTANATVELAAGVVANSASSKGKHYVVSVPNGTVIIKGNITQDDGPYGSVAEIPQLVIVARDIKILDTVDRVDAWLVATGTGVSQGIVNTCVNSTGNTPNLSSGVCNLPLRINGPVIARELKSWRTLVYSGSCVITGSEGCNDPKSGSGKDAGSPAEVMNLPGTSLLWAYGGGSDLQQAQTTYTIELPPYY